MTAQTLVFAVHAREAVRIGLEQFHEALAHLAGMLADVEEELSGQRPRVAWEVAGLQAGSAVVTIEPAAGLGAEERRLAARVGRALTSGLGELAEAGRAGVRPQSFNNRALDHAAALARMLRDGLGGMSLTFGNDRVDLTLSIEAAARTVLEYVETIGSVDGYLEVLQGQEGRPPRFRVRDRVYGKGVWCIVPEPLVDRALASWRKRVLVSGSIRYDSDGHPYRVMVQDIEPVPSEGLPDAEDVRGILGDLGGMAPEDYLEHLYHGKEP